MDLDKLRSLLGLSSTATLDDIMAAVKKLSANSQAAAETQKHLASIAAAAGLSAAQAIDETSVTAICAKLKAPAQPGAELQAQVDELQKQLATMRAESAGKNAEQAVAAAIAGGKLAPAQKDWALDYAARNPDGFKKFMEVQPVIIKDARIAPNGIPPSVDETALSDAEKSVCAQLNLKPEDFIAQRKLENAKATRSAV